MAKADADILEAGTVNTAIRRRIALVSSMYTFCDRFDHPVSEAYKLGWCLFIHTALHCQPMSLHRDPLTK